MRTLTCLVALALLALLAVAAAPAAAAEAAGAARKNAEVLFQKYIDLEHAFDPALADLYSDTARIEVRRVSPQGSAEMKTTPAPQYKEMIRKVMPLAKRRHDVSYYEGATYTAEGARVRIKATRFAEFKHFVSPIELLVGPGPAGSWLIFEEISEQHSGPPPTAPPK